MAKEDLIPMNQRTEQEQKEIAVKGGKASGAARRKKRTMKTAAQLILSLEVKDAATLETLQAAGIDVPEGMNNMEAIIAVAVVKARNGDLKALRFLRDTIGEDPQLTAYRERTEAIKKSNSKLSDLADDWVQAVLASDPD